MGSWILLSVVPMGGARVMLSSLSAEGCPGYDYNLQSIVMVTNSMKV